MALKSVRGRSVVIGPSIKQDLPISLDFEIYEGSIVYASDGSLKYSDGTQWANIGVQGLQGIQGPAGADGAIGAQGEIGRAHV